MPRYIAQVQMQDVSGLSKDRFENTFHFQTTGVEGGTRNEALNVAARIAEFYVGGVGEEPPWTAYITPAVNRACIVKVYDYAAAKPRPILFQANFTLPTNSGAEQLKGLPPQIALCLSYYSARNIPRQRGRLYLGPFSVAATGGTEPRPVQAMVDQMIAAANRMAIVGDGVAGGSFLQFVGGESIVTANVGWCVYTSLGDGSTSAPHPTFLLVSGGWVDDEWDGQRRRRVEASKRTSFTQDG